MAGGRRGQRKPATPSSSSAWQREPGASIAFGHERSLDSQKEGSCSFSLSVSSKNSPPQMVTPVQAPESPESPLQIVTPVEPPKSLDSQLQMVTPVQAPKSQDSPVQLVASIQPLKPLESRRTSSSSGAVGSDFGAVPFDICMGNSKGTFLLRHSLLEINREKRRATKLSNSPAVQHLRAGMVLLKNFLKPDDQVKIIERCWDLGVGPGGFYQPGYRNGGKLSLRMMCLGKNWDPDSSSYGDIRPFDAAQPPKIPEELTKFVQNAIDASHEFLKQRGKGATDPAVELPLMSPDICIVNFYTTSGKLGLHQDKDEDESSLRRGLPVVSFSFGDTAEFLYGDVRDEAKTSKIKLESGDVLIFGGPSRHIFNGVSNIAPKSAPLWVTDKANLRPGCLNLTFRQCKQSANITPAPFYTNLRPECLNRTLRQHKGSLNVTPAPFHTCMCENDAAPPQHLGPGMVLLKKFLKATDQVEIVTLCHNLGVKTGGSYTPGYYSDETSLSPHMMCLGKKCDPYSSSYRDLCPSDGAQPPGIPKKFKKLVEDAIEASHELLEQRGGTSNPLVELPPMSPDMCTVSFVTSVPITIPCQDISVTKASLTKELPIVVFSLGDTAEFLYRGIRDDVDSKIDLESGDVLIFGGQSRRISHAVSSIKPKTAPKWLADKTNLQVGHLSLTFKQY